MGTHPEVKVWFDLGADAWHGYATESLWAEDLGGGRYRLNNSPFYAKEASFQDVVLAKANEDGQLFVSGVLLRAGHSTYRVIRLRSADDPGFDERWAPLQALGCSFEGNGSLLSIDVPAAADIYQVYDLLQQGADVGVWDFEEGHCGHPTQDGGPEKAAK